MLVSESVLISLSLSLSLSLLLLLCCFSLVLILCYHHRNFYRYDNKDYYCFYCCFVVFLNLFFVGYYYYYFCIPFSFRLIPSRVISLFPISLFLFLRLSSLCSSFSFFAWKFSLRLILINVSLSPSIIVFMVYSPASSRDFPPPRLLSLCPLPRFRG